MKCKTPKKHSISFPFGLYWRQLFSSYFYVKFINPFSFWHRYKVDHLETCWELNTVRFLERCYRLKRRSTQDTAPISNVAANGVYRGLSWEKVPQNTVLISRPNWKLKYRGITYYVNGCLGINMDRISNNSKEVTTNKSEKISIVNNNIEP